MKILRVERLIDVGGFTATAEWQQIDSQIQAAIKAISWPPGAALFQFNPQQGRSRGQGNGVRPIKVAWQHYLYSHNWTLEHKLHALVQLGGSKPRV